MAQKLADHLRVINLLRIRCTLIKLSRTKSAYHGKLLESPQTPQTGSPPALYPSSAAVPLFARFTQLLRRGFLCFFFVLLSAIVTFQRVELLQHKIRRCR